MRVLLICFALLIAASNLAGCGVGSVEIENSQEVIKPKHMRNSLEEKIHYIEHGIDDRVDDLQNGIKNAIPDKVDEIKNGIKKKVDKIKNTY